MPLHRDPLCSQLIACPALLSQNLLTDIVSKLRKSHPTAAFGHSTEKLSKSSCQERGLVRSVSKAVHQKSTKFNHVQSFFASLIYVFYALEESPVEFGHDGLRGKGARR